MWQVCSEVRFSIVFSFPSPVAAAAGGKHNESQQFPTKVILHIAKLRVARVDNLQDAVRGANSFDYQEITDRRAKMPGGAGKYLLYL